MRKVIYLFLFTSSNLFCSDLDTTKYAVPNIIFDSMTFEISVGRRCAIVSSLQTTEIAKQEAEIIAQLGVIKLKNSEVKHLEEVIESLQKQSQADKILVREKLDRFKTRIRRLTFIVIGQTGAVVLLVIVLL